MVPSSPAKIIMLSLLAIAVVLLTVMPVQDSYAVTAPEAPTLLTATAVSTSQIDLTWTAPSNDGGSAITGYKIERESPTGGGFATLVANTASTLPFYSDTGLEASIPYNYRVSAINDIGTGSASNADAATTPASLKKTFGSGGEKVITFRDISSTSPTPDPVISLNNNIYNIGEQATLTITDFNANLDPFGIDTTKAFVYSNVQVPLTETEINSGVFVGTFTFNGNTAVVYYPAPPEAARAKITLSLDGPGSVTITDYIIDVDTDVEFQNLPIRPVTHAIIVEVSGILTSEVSVKMSYANGFFDPLDNKAFLWLYYDDFDPDFTWGYVTRHSPPFTVDSGFNDSTAQTITSNNSNPAIPFCCFQGRYVVGFDTGVLGGGAGGMVRPGLVLNLLAGLDFGGGGVDRTAPSLLYAAPTSTQDGFGGTLVTDDNNAFPLVINGKGFYLPAFSTFIEPVQVKTGQDVDLTLTFKDNTGVEHIAIHFVNENNDEISDTDAIITYHNGVVTKVDPQGILADDITFSKTKDGNKYSFNFGTSFDEPGIRHLIITAWDGLLNSGNTKVFNALSVSGNSIPDDNISHMIYLDLGAYFITANGIFAAGEKPDAVAQPVIEYDYPDYVGRTERHDSIIYDNIENEKTRASQVMAEKFNLDTDTFVEDNEVKPYDTSRRAPELDLAFVGHKLRDFTLSPEENEKLIKELTWKEHLKAQKILDSMLASSKYHK